MPFIAPADKVAAAAPPAAPPAPGGGFVAPQTAVADEITPERIAQTPDFDPLAALRRRDAALGETAAALDINAPGYAAEKQAADAAYETAKQTDPVRALFSKAHAARVKTLAGSKGYDPAQAYADAQQFPPREVANAPDAAGFTPAERLGSAAQTAQDVALYRYRHHGGFDKTTPGADWGRFGHGLKEQAKDAFGVGAVVRSRAAYTPEDLYLMGKGALAGAGITDDEDTSEKAQAQGQLAARRVQSGVLQGGMGLINLGYGIADWWRKSPQTDYEIKKRFEEEVRRKVQIPRALAPQNLRPAGGGADAPAYGELVAAAGGEKELPTAWADWLRFAKPAGAGQTTGAEKRAADLATSAEFAGYGALMHMPGYSHIAKALAGYGTKAAGAGAEGFSKTLGALIDSKLGRYATVGGAVAEGLHAGPVAGVAAYAGARLARAAARIAESAGAGVKNLGDEILAGQPLKGGGRAGRTLTTAARGAIEGGVGALPFAAGADQPEDGLSTMLGLALMGAAHAGGREFVTGREWNAGTGKELADLGANLDTGSGLDAAHRAATAGLNPRERDTINAVRGLMSRFKDPEGNPLELHAVSAAAYRAALKQAFPGYTDAQLDAAAKTPGVTLGARALINTGHVADKTQPALHEGGHLADAALRALDENVQQSAQAAVAETLYGAGGQPAPEFAKFTRGYNAKATAENQLDPATPEGRVAAENEFIAEHFRNAGNRKGGALEQVGKLATGDTLYGRMGAAFDNWAKRNGLRAPDQLSEFNWQEVPAFTARFGQVLADAFAGAHKKGAPEPGGRNQIARNATRIAEIDALAEGAKTPALLRERQKLARENEELGKALSESGGAPEQTATPAAPEDPAAARNRATLALIKLGWPRRDAVAAVAAARGATDGELVADVYKRRDAAQKAAQTPAAPAPGAPPEQTPAPVSQPGAPVPVAHGEYPAPGYTAQVGAPGVGLLSGVRLAAPPTEPGRGALSGEKEPGITTSFGAKSQEQDQQAVAADDAAAEQLIAETAKGGERMPHILALVTAAAGADKALLQRRVDARTGKVTFSGRLDYGLPEHRAFVRELGLTPEGAARLREAQTSEGAKFVDYWSAKNLDPGDITGKQRQKEYAADKAKRSRDELQRNKAIIFTGVTAWPNGSVVQKGVSVDKYVANAAKLLAAAQAHGLGVDYTGINDPHILQDLGGYVANHQANIKGDGSGPVAGETPTPGYEPYLIPRNRFDLLNAAFHVDAAARVNEARAQRADYEQELALYNAELAARDARPRGKKGKKPNPPHKPAIRDETLEKGEDAQAKARENQWGVDDATGDVNPFRALLNAEGQLTFTNKAGETRRGTTDVLETVFENLSPDMIDAIRNAPDGPQETVRDVGFTGDVKGVLAGGLPKWGNVAAGFMPDAPGDRKPALEDFRLQAQPLALKGGGMNKEPVFGKATPDAAAYRAPGKVYDAAGTPELPPGWQFVIDGAIERVTDADGKTVVAYATHPQSKAHTVAQALKVARERGAAPALPGQGAAFMPDGAGKEPRLVKTDILTPTRDPAAAKQRDFDPDELGMSPEEFEAAEAALADFNKRRKGQVTEVWSLPITPALAAAAKAGQPLFMPDSTPGAPLDRFEAPYSHQTVNPRLKTDWRDVAAANAGGSSIKGARGYFIMPDGRLFEATSEFDGSSGMGQGVDHYGWATAQENADVFHIPEGLRKANEDPESFADSMAQQDAFLRTWDYINAQTKARVFTSPGSARTGNPFVTVELRQPGTTLRSALRAVQGWLGKQIPDAPENTEFSIEITTPNLSEYLTAKSVRELMAVRNPRDLMFMPGTPEPPTSRQTKLQKQPALADVTLAPAAAAAAADDRKRKPALAQ